MARIMLMFVMYSLLHSGGGLPNMKVGYQPQSQVTYGWSGPKAQPATTPVRYGW
jgi:hypothetical protein